MAMVPTINDIRTISPILTEKLNIDIYNHSLSFLRRRFAYVFDKLNVRSINSFIESLENQDLVDEFYALFCVEDTEMFRDPSFWRTLKNKVIPSIHEDNLNVWFPDLVSSEELFSLLVILSELNIIYKSTIYCNVSVVNNLKLLQEGFVSSRHLDISKNNFKRLEISSQFEDYFNLDNKKVYLKNELLKHIHFIKSNLYNDSPTVLVSLVLYRNRMIYFNQKLQCVTEQKIYKNIKKGGFIALGIKEKISDSNQELFKLYDADEQIYLV